MLIFKRMRMNNDLRVGAPPGSPVEISESGYMTSDLFLQIAGLIAEAYGRAASIENAVNGYRTSRVWPVDRLVFKDHDFYVADNLNEHKASETHEDVENEEPNEEPIITETNVDNEILWPELPSPQESLATTNTPTTIKTH
ncbi:hypothetical protein J6590_079387 [Homalodisca vitripennis]|nr:hypothetical protein J6590_079387 [Homalodisca vitripennis]